MTGRAGIDERIVTVIDARSVIAAAGRGSRAARGTSFVLLADHLRVPLDRDAVAVVQKVAVVLFIAAAAGDVAPLWWTPVFLRDCVRRNEAPSWVVHRSIPKSSAVKPSNCSGQVIDCDVRWPSRSASGTAHSSRRSKKKTSEALPARSATTSVSS